MAQAGELKTKVTADISQYESAMRRAEGIAKGAEARIGAAFAGVKGIIGGLAGLGVGVGLAKGVASVIELGGALTDLSDQTGVSVKNLVVLQRRFEDAGLEAADAGAAINRMQKYLESIKEDSGKQGLIHELGLSVAELFAMSPEKQFQAIGKALGSIDSASERAAKSMEIFGKAGGKLTRVFQGDIFQNASADLKAKAESLAANSKIYDEIGDKMGKANNALKTFFLGVAENVAPAISTTIDKLAQIDLKSQGKEFGDQLVRGATALTNAVNEIRSLPDQLPQWMRDMLSDHVKSQNYGGDAFQFKTTPSAAFIPNILSRRYGKRDKLDLSKFPRRDDEGYPMPGLPKAFTAYGMQGGIFGDSLNLDAFPGFDDEGNLMPGYDGPVKVRGRGVLPPPLRRAYGGLPNWRAFNARRNPRGAFFAENFAPNYGRGAFGAPVSFADRLNMTGPGFGESNELGLPGFGKSTSGVGVDAAERSRQMRKRLLEDATFSNPLAPQAQLNAIVNQQMQQARDRERADAIREKINAGRRERGEAEIQGPPKSAAQAAYEAALNNVMKPLIEAQTKSVQTLVAQ